MIVARSFPLWALSFSFLIFNPVRLMASPVYNVTAFSACGNGSSTDPADLNDSGQVVGTCTDSAGNSSGFLFSGGAVSTIKYPGADDTVLTGINNAGLIVGYYLLGGSSSSFIYENGSFTPFPFPGTTVWGANDTGLFVGYSPDSGFITDGTNFQVLNFPGAFDTLALSINNADQVVGYYETTTTAAGFLFADAPVYVYIYTGTSCLWRRYKQ